MMTSRCSVCGSARSRTSRTRPMAFHVSMTVDPDQPIPATRAPRSCRPASWSGRFGAPEPVYTPVAKDPRTAPPSSRLEDTAVLVTFDDVKQQLTDFATTSARTTATRTAPCPRRSPRSRRSCNATRPTCARRSPNCRALGDRSVRWPSRLVSAMTENLNTFHERASTTRRYVVSPPSRRCQRRPGGEPQQPPGHPRDLATVLNRWTDIISTACRIKASVADPQRPLLPPLADRRTNFAGTTSRPFPTILATRSRTKLLPDGPHSAAF